MVFLKCWDDQTADIYADIDVNPGSMNLQSMHIWTNRGFGDMLSIVKLSNQPMVKAGKNRPRSIEHAFNQLSLEDGSDTIGNM